MKLSDEVTAVLALCETKQNRLRITARLDPRTYRAVDKVLQAAGGKWNSRKSAHLFPADTDAGEVVARLLADGQVMTDADAQFFATPAAVAGTLIGLAELEPEFAALEPSAGRGGIAARLASHVAAVDCIELQEKYAADIRAAGYARRITVADFLAVTPEPVYPRVVMNPPFTGGQDIRHVEHALRFLAPGGLLVSVMMASVLWRDDRQQAAFRELVKRAGGGIDKLPEGSFKESGTEISTVAAVIPYPVHYLAGAR